MSDVRNLEVEEELRANGARLREVLAAHAEIIQRLPAYPIGITVNEHDGYWKGACCEVPDLRVVTTGLEQNCRAEVEEWQPPTHPLLPPPEPGAGIMPVSWTRGWDDMGDMDGPSWLACNNCGGLFGSGWDWS